MQSDKRKLLEAAAKAAGVHPHDIECTWNPLTSDGDALRLAVKLRLAIVPTDEYIIVRRAPFVDVEQDVANDAERAAATRRAIVRAAGSLATPGSQT